jgi:peptidylprolyl isomerase
MTSELSMRSFFFALPLTLIAVSLLAQAPATPPPPDELPASEVAVPVDGEKSATGLVSKLIRKGSSNEKAEATDVVTVHYTGWSSEGRLFDSSVVRGPASTFPLDKVMAGWRECVQLMTLGEKRRCWIPENLAYKGQAGRPKGTVMFDIELIDRRGNPLVAPPDVMRVGRGARNPSRFGRVTVHYTGWTTDGRMFDSSVTKGQPATFRLDDVIKGWTEGVPLMVEGERTRFWVPENLAYGGKGDGPRGMLVFDIELVRIEN